MYPKKAVLKGKVHNYDIKKSEISQIIDLMMHLKTLDKQEQAKPKISK
jgi:hypothetical protein